MKRAVALALWTAAVFALLKIAELGRNRNEIEP
jgi:hypothetical protein